MTYTISIDHLNSPNVSSADQLRMTLHTTLVNYIRAQQEEWMNPTTEYWVHI